MGMQTVRRSRPGHLRRHRLRHHFGGQRHRFGVARTAVVLALVVGVFILAAAPALRGMIPASPRNSAGPSSA